MYIGLFGLLALSYLLAPAQGYQIPADLEDGAYLVSLDSSDIAPLASRTTPDHGSLVAAVSARQGTAPPLPSTQTTCRGAELESRADFDSARQLFESYCNTYRTYSNNTAVLVRVNTAIAYICNFVYDDRCWASEYEEASGFMDKTCGKSNTSVVYIPSYGKSYGRDNWNTSICLTRD
jgi:hypothetical protein